MRDIILIFVFMALAILFASPKYVVNNNPALSGVLYDSATSADITDTIATINTQPSKVNTVGPAATTTTIASNHNKAVAKTTTKAVETVKTVVEPIKEAVSVKEKEAETPVIQINNDVILDTYLAIHQAVTNSEKSYFFIDVFAQNGDILISLVSHTVINEKNILKVKIDNNSNAYFFLGTISLSSNNKLIPIKIYGNKFVKAKDSVLNYYVFDKTLYSKYNLVIQESSKGQEFKIEFNTK